MASTSVNNKQGSTSGSREYCLRWNNHQPNMVQFFGSLYSTETFVDVTLISAEGKKVQAHKLVLSACSPYFQHVFENHPCKHPIVILKDVQHADLQTIVSFIYNGEVNISQDRINVILKTANALQVKGLAEVPADELKRVSSGTNESAAAVVKTQQLPPLTSSASWSLGDASDPGNEIPRKKLKKSTSAAAAYHSEPNSTNGDHSNSVDSGVGASVSRSIDEGPSEELSVMQKRPSSLPAPPPLLPKSRSLDHNLTRDSHGDPEMNFGHHDGHSYDDSSVGMDRGYELEVSDLKIDAISDDCDIEFLEEEEDYDEESYGRYPSADYDNGSVEQNEMNQSKSKYQSSHPQSSTSVSAAPLYRQPLRVSSAAGERRRRGRPLLRQPRIKRSDNEPSPGGGREQFGSDLYLSDPVGGCLNDANGHQNLITNTDQERSGRSGSTDRKQRTQINQSNLPIVRVSQCSPTPPSSPPLHPSSPSYKEEQSPVLVSTISFPSSTAAGSTFPASSMIITSSSHATTLLTVPTVSESQHSSVYSSAGSHLVKQISQPHLPSHTVVPLGGITTGNPVIRRQYSTPIPGQPSRIVQTVKQGTLIQILPSETNFKEEEAERTYIIDIVPSVPSGKDSGSPSPRRELRKEGSSEQSGPSRSLSRDDSLSLVEETGSNSASFDDGLPINRSGHCPALRPGPALGCNFCWNSVDTCGRILRRKTKYHCPECHINLCIVPCFQEYHEKTDKKKRPRSKLGLPKPSSM